MFLAPLTNQNVLYNILAFQFSSSPPFMDFKFAAFVFLIVSLILVFTGFIFKFVFLLFSNFCFCDYFSFIFGQTTNCLPFWPFPLSPVYAHVNAFFSEWADKLFSNEVKSSMVNAKNWQRPIILEYSQLTNFAPKWTLSSPKIRAFKL